MRVGRGLVGAHALVNGKTSKSFIGFTRRPMSSLGSPMFPHRPRPELHTFEEGVESIKKAGTDPSGQSGERGAIDILAEHGGKIALVVFGGVVALIYTYYLSGKDRNRIEDKIADAVYIEPYEVQELRFFNKLSYDEFGQVVSQARAAFPSGQASYAEFMRFLKRDVVLTPSSNGWQDPEGTVAPVRSKLELKSTYLFDRMMMGLSSTKVKETSQATGDAETTLSAPAQRVQWTEEQWSLELLLGMLNLAMVSDAEARVQALFELADGAGRTAGASTSTTAQESIEGFDESSNPTGKAGQADSAVSDDASEDAAGAAAAPATAQRTVSKGECNRFLLRTLAVHVRYSVGALYREHQYLYSPLPSCRRGGESGGCADRHGPGASVQADHRVGSEVAGEAASPPQRARHGENRSLPFCLHPAFGCSLLEQE